MTPTQAQIEAGDHIKRLKDIALWCKVEGALSEWTDLELAADFIAALTAAAEVGEPEPHDVKNARNQAALISAIEEINSLRRELAARTEVGEPRLREFGRGATWVDQADVMDNETLVKHLRIASDATIERCAQVAESMKPFGYDIAAAIRALKDNPCGTIGS